MTGAPTDTVYTNGDQGVAASIDKWGNLIIDFQTTKAQIRRLVYDYTNDPSNPTTAPPGTGAHHYLSTIGGNLGTMQVGQAIDVASCPFYGDNPSYRHSFDRACQSGLGSAGGPLRRARRSDPGASGGVIAGSNADRLQPRLPSNPSANP